MTRLREAGLLLAAAAVLLVGCAGPAPAQRAGAGADRVDGRVVLLAAASLTDVLPPVAEAFEREHPGVDVVLSLGASSALAQQVLSGAPADVFAAASPATMDVVVEAGVAQGAPRLMTRNVLEIAVPEGNPGRVQGLADLGREELRVALCAEQVPCGAAAGRALQAAGVTAAPDTLEQDVRAVLAKVRLGEVDAGLVYRTDVLSAAGEVEGVAFPESAQAVNDYPVVALAEAPNPRAAAALVEHLLAAEAQAALARAGFTPA